tara:strand:+ start:258 stop:668 length:411 start_codon:yes stop_codon:yes gene_type:complete
VKKIICCLVLVFSFPLYADVVGKKLICIGDREKFRFFGIDFYNSEQAQYWYGQDTGRVFDFYIDYKPLPKRIEFMNSSTSRLLFIDRKNLKAYNDDHKNNTLRYIGQCEITEENVGDTIQNLVTEEYEKQAEGNKL